MLQKNLYKYFFITFLNLLYFCFFDDDINIKIIFVFIFDSCCVIVQEYIEWLTVCRANVSELDAEEKEKRTRRYNNPCGGEQR